MKKELNHLRQYLIKSKIIRFCASLKITVGSLLILFLLTFWGTVSQVSHGLYQAQEQFFFSWYFLGFGFLPFPGARLICWILFINLSAVALIRFKYTSRQAGIIIIHLGMMTYLISAFILFHTTVESHVSLIENRGTNLSSAYHEWELSIWKDGDKDQIKTVYAWDDNILLKSKTLPTPVDISIIKYYQNSTAYISKLDISHPDYVNANNIADVKREPLNKEAEKNVPAIIFQLNHSNDNNLILLFGGEERPTTVNIDNTQYHFQLRHKKYPLPFTIILNDFQRELHPGTNKAKSYKSIVTINHEGVAREAMIWMNHPYRYKNYTLFQSSFSIDNMGREYSTFAVVKNSGRYFPYVSSFIVFFGLCIHFLGMSFRRRIQHA